MTIEYFPLTVVFVVPRGKALPYGPPRRTLTMPPLPSRSSALNHQSSAAYEIDIAVEPEVAFVVLPLLTMSLPEEVIIVFPRNAEPVNATVCVAPPTGTFTTAVAGPAVLGRKLMLNVQVASAARVAPQVLLLTENDLAFTPVTAGFPIVTGAAPVLCTVSTWVVFGNPMNVFVNTTFRAPRITEPAASSPNRNSPTPGTTASNLVI
nr:hypothetical protein [Curtobacterium flaccumfaciens]